VQTILKTVLKTVLIATLSLTLTESSAMAMPASTTSVPLGSILEGLRAREIFDSTSTGATIYDGDLLETQEGESLRVRLGKSQIQLNQSTAAQVHAVSGGYSANLIRGSVIVSSPRGQSFALFANAATIRFTGTQDTVAEVTLVNYGRLQLTTQAGAIQVFHEGGVKTIEAGESLLIVPSAEESAHPGPGATPKQQSVGSHGAGYFWAVAAPVAAAIIIWRLLESPSRP
jgi:ferric-dicitrate binding protein FerR (iron transport regulator)